MSNHRKKEYNFNLEKVISEGYNIYFITCEKQNRYNSTMVFNLYIDNANQILHIFDPLGKGYFKPTRTVINTINQIFINDLIMVLNLKNTIYDVYIHTSNIYEPMYEDGL